MPLRILVADDNSALRSSLGQMLTSSHDGWVICAEAENGQQAVSKAIDQRPDVVVLDLSMPVMDGLEAAREIANVLASVPIFLYTLHTIPALEQEAAKFGITQVVCKPNWQSLFDAIESNTKKEGENPEAPIPVIRSRAFVASGRFTRFPPQRGVATQVSDTPHGFPREW